MRYRLRTLLILLAIGPPLLAVLIVAHRNGVEVRRSVERFKRERDARLKAEQQKTAGSLNPNP